MKPGDVIPSNSVIIPTDVARRAASLLRDIAAGTDTTRSDIVALADLLDPQPSSLREQVADALHVEHGPHWHLTPAEVRACEADAVLAVVADWLAAQPLVHWNEQQRDYDVSLLRGQS